MIFSLSLLYGRCMYKKMPIELLEILVCPITKEPLRYDQESESLISEKAEYQIKNGIPIMLVSNDIKYNNQ